VRATQSFTNDEEIDEEERRAVLEDERLDQLHELWLMGRDIETYEKAFNQVIHDPKKPAWMRQAAKHLLAAIQIVELSP
jgi:hypothetical protein